MVEIEINQIIMLETSKLSEEEVDSKITTSTWTGTLIEGVELIQGDSKTNCNIRTEDQ